MTATEIQSGHYEWETGNVIVERFLKLNPMEISAVLVRGYGPFMLEFVAERAFKTLQINPEAPPLQPALLQKYFQRKHGVNA